LINLTDRPVVLDPTNSFITEVRESLSTFKKQLLERSSPIPWPAADDDPSKVAGELIEFAHGNVRRKGNVPVSKNIQALAMTLGYQWPLRRDDAAILGGRVRTLLFKLSASGALLLPRSTAFSKSLRPQCTGVLERPIMHATLAAADEIALRKLRSHLLGIVASTNWHLPSDFDINELAAFQQQLARNGQLPTAKKGNPNPFIQLLRALEEVSGTGVTRELRHQYMMWQESQSFPTINFHQFRSDPLNFVGVRIHGLKRERVETDSRIATRREKQRGKADEKRKTKDVSPWLAKLQTLAKLNGPNAPEEYFEALRGRSKDFRKEEWLNFATPYPGREHVDIREIGKVWFPVMRAWVKHRNNHYETDSEPRLVLHILCDYLLLYLPWWCEQHADANISFPSSPRAFLRYLFVSRTVFHEEQQNETAKLPKTLLELLKLRRPTADGRNRVITLWHLFFQFVITAFEDNRQVVVKGMTNPLQPNFDKVKSSRRTKTDKIPFAEDVFPYLVLFAQAIETFGEFLQQRAYEDDAFAGRAYGEPYGYETYAWGYVPFIAYRGRTFPVLWIPNLYTVARRTFRTNPPGVPGIYVNGRRINTGADRVVSTYMPHVSVVRLLLALIETGQRGQSIQWLDRRTWGSKAPHLRPLAELYTSMPAHMFTYLLLNTDKVKKTEWTSFISWRVRRSFLSEQHFQECLAEPYTYVEVNYENRKNSRFAPIVPLFRSSHVAGPWSDSNYTDRWIEFMFAFEQFYNKLLETSPEESEPLQLVVVTPSFDEQGSPVRVIRRKDGDSQYCPLKYAVRHTPHACRSTYATHKDGDLEVSEIAEQLGHENPVVSTTYQVPSDKRVIAKLEASERRTMAGIYDVEGKGVAYIHADRPSSTVRQAFSEDREAAIANFGFVSGIALWSMDELNPEDANSIELLRQSPSSVIRWHPTHVCPVGNQCPSDIVVKIGGYQRCGLCPLAAKCVDHLPAIAAKKNELKERIRMTAKRIRVLDERGAGRGILDSLHKSMENDAKELMGWELSTDILHKKLDELGEANETYHVEQPEMVRRHLQLVTRNDSESAFFLQRIADSNAYPLLESPEVRARAVKFVKVILARAKRIDDAAFLELEPYSELAAFASLVKPMAEAKGLSLTDLAAVLSGEALVGLEVTRPPKLLDRY
jgi:hypothetical protein